MIITTSLRENETLITRAQELAHELGADYQPRRKLSLAKCLERFGPFYLLYKDRLSFINSDASELTFHPDTAALRIKAPHDALVSLLGKSPKTILDTTMGLASDSLVMAAAGNQLTALESQEVIFRWFLVVWPRIRQVTSSLKRPCVLLKLLRAIACLF